MSPGKPSPRAPRTRRSRDERTEDATRRGSRTSRRAMASCSFFDEVSRWCVATCAMKMRRWFVVCSCGHWRAKRRAADRKDRGPRRTTVSTTLPEVLWDGGRESTPACCPASSWRAELAVDGLRVRGSREDDSTDTLGHSWNSLRRRLLSPESTNSKPSTTTRHCACARTSNGDVLSFRTPSSRSSSSATRSASLALRWRRRSWSLSRAATMTSLNAASRSSYVATPSSSRKNKTPSGKKRRSAAYCETAATNADFPAPPRPTTDTSRLRRVRLSMTWYVSTSLPKKSSGAGGGLGSAAP
mmetsp:Transcript_12780/g.38547  ORF Transcript_12780/g.38547 Transcript_12780/m.38547 type:complete len:300 (+) Transcript_12780:631-1530(+)